jgi:AcrR family transcriptional regulator
VPKLWTDTIEAHRRAVTGATLDATAALVHDRGLASVSMSAIARSAGIGRATLYKYFPDIEAILLAWHERHVADHLRRLAEVRDQGGPPQARLEAVLGAFAMMTHQRPDREVGALLHRGPHILRAEQAVSALLEGLLEEAARAGTVRTDVSSSELASFCLHALSAASRAPSKAALERLVAVTLAGLRPEAPASVAES